MEVLLELWAGGEQLPVGVRQLILQVADRMRASFAAGLFARHGASMRGTPGLTSLLIKLVGNTRTNEHDIDGLLVELAEAPPGPPFLSAETADFQMSSGDRKIGSVGCVVDPWKRPVAEGSPEVLKYRPICLVLSFQRKRLRIKQIGRYLTT